MTTNTTGNQTIHGTSGKDRITGGRGNDVLFGYAGADDIRGGDGNDVIDGGAGDDDLDGDDGNDVLIGGAGNDRLDGGDGDDLLDGGTGHDRMDGGNGNDTIIFRFAEHAGPVTGKESDAVRVDGDDGIDTLRLVLTRAEWLRADVQNDVRNLLNFIAQRTKSDGEVTGANFDFTSVDLRVERVERVVVVVDSLALDPRDEAVTLRADTITTSEDDASVVVNLLGNDSVPDLVRSVTITRPGQGTVSLSTNFADPAAPQANVVYTPNATYYQYLAVGERATDSFTYTVTDADGDVSTQTVSVTIVGANDGPLVVSGKIATAFTEGAAVLTDTGTILFSDLDLTDTHSVTVGEPRVSVSGVATNVAPTGGFGVLTAAVNENTTDQNNQGTIVWTYRADDAQVARLAAGQTATQVYTLTLTDRAGAVVTQDVTVTLTGTNDAPTVTAAVSNGAAVEDEITTASGTIGFADADISDTHGVAVSATGIGYVGTLTAAITDVSAGDGAGAVRWDFVVDTASIQTLAQGQVLIQSYTVTVTDVTGASIDQLVTITITGTNDAPIAVGDVGSATEDGALLTGSVATNDSDIDTGATRSFALDAPVAGLTLQANGDYAFDPANDAYQAMAEGEVRTFVAGYTVTDEHGATARSTLTITLTGTNDAPIAVADTSTTSENAAITVDVLANDIDIDTGAVLTLTAAAAPVGFGTASILDNRIVFTPGADFDRLSAGASETIVVTYTVEDEFGASSASTLTITVTGTNDAPIAVADTASGLENQSLTIDVLANDTDVDDGSVFTLTSVVAPAGKGVGSVIGNQLVFTPGTDFDRLALGATETVVVAYTMTDEHGVSSSSSVTITITGTNDAPLAVADTATTSENAAITIDVLANDIDVDDGRVLTLVDAAVVGAAGRVRVENNALVFTPGTDFDRLAVGATATVVVLYNVRDEHGGESAATVRITVTGTNDAPVAVADVGAVVEDRTIAGSLATNDSDVDDGTVLDYTLDAPVAGLTLDRDGSYSFDASNAAYQTLAEGATRVVTANYTVTDGQGGTATSMLAITVTGTNDAPTAVVDVSAVAEDFVVSGSVAANDSDLDTGAVLSYALNAPVAGLTLNTNGTYSFAASNAAYQALAPGEVQVVTAGYTVSDQLGATSQSTLTITVTGRNDAPVAVVDTASAIEDGGIVTGTVRANDSDVDNGAVLSYAAINSVAGLTIDANGGYSFDPSNTAYQNLGAGATRVVTGTYRVTDQNGAGATSSLSITVTGTNDAPVVGAVTLRANRLGNGGFDATPNFAGWTVTTGSTGTVGGFTSTATIDRSGSIIPGDTAVAVLNYNATTPAGFGTGYGPTIKSDAFAGNAGDTVSFTYRLSAGGDQAVGRAYIRDATTGAIVQTIFDYQVPFVGSTGVQTVNVVLATSGQYTIDFQVGSYDATGGRVIGARLDIGFAGILANGISEDAAFTFSNGRTLLLANSTDVDVGDVLSVAPFAMTSMMGASVTLAADGSLVVDPRGSLQIQALKQGESAVDTVTFTVSDGKGGLTTGTANVTLVGANDGPVANADVASTTENQGVTVDVLANDTDVDHDAVLTLVSAAVAPGKGSVSVVANQLVFAPGTAFDHLSAGASEAVVVTYAMRDEFGATSTSTATITVVGANDAPIAVAGTASGPEDTTIAGRLVASDVDIGTALVFSLVSSTPGLTVNADGSWSLDAADAAYQSLTAGQTQVVNAIYAVTDGIATTQASLAITVSGRNEPVVARPDTATTTENAAVGGTVLANDSYTGGVTSTGNILVNGSFEFGHTVGIGSYGFVGSLPGWTPSGGAIEVWGDGFGGNIASDGDFFLELDYAGAQDAYSQTLTTQPGRTYTISFDLAQRSGTSPASNPVEFLVNGVVLGHFTPPSTTFTTQSVTFVGSGSDVITFREPASANDGVGGLIDNLRIAAPSDVAVSAVNGAAGGVGTAVAGSNGGNFVVAADGSYTFDPGTAFDRLAVGETATSSIGYTLTDSTGSSTTTLTVTVTGTNDAPTVVAPLAAQAAFTGASTTIATAQAFADVDATDVLSFSATRVDGSVLPSGVVIDSATGLMTVASTSPGAVPIRVTASDGNGGTISSDFILTLSVPDVIGTSAGETLNGSLNGETIVGSGGNDVLNGGAGNDVIYGDARGEEGPSQAPPAGLTAIAQSYYSAGNSLTNGLGGTAGFGENAVSRNDDEYSPIVDLTSVFGSQGVNFFGQYFTTISINTNGNLTFGQQFGSFTPSPIAPTGLPPLIAAFWTDIDTRAGVVTTSPGGTSTGSNLVYWDMDTINGVFTATWDDVGMYSNGRVPNAFQIQLIDRGAGDFDILLRYETIQWNYSGARAGYSGGGTAYELPLSENGQTLNLDTAVGNTGLTGVYVFQVRNGQVSTSANDTIDGGAGQDTLIGGAGLDTFVFRAGESDGDIVLDFNGSGAAAGDSLRFEGFGTAADGATFTQVDETHWQIRSGDGLRSEIITFANAAPIDPTDFSFI